MTCFAIRGFVLPPRSGLRPFGRWLRPLAGLIVLVALPVWQAGAQTVPVPDLFAGPHSGGDRINLGELRLDPGFEESREPLRSSRELRSSRSLQSPLRSDRERLRAPYRPQSSSGNTSDPADGDMRASPAPGDAASSTLAGRAGSAGDLPEPPDPRSRPLAPLDPTLTPAILSTDRLVPGSEPTDAPALSLERGADDRAEPLPRLANPPLAAGVAAEASSLTQALRTSGPIIQPVRSEDDPFAAPGIRAGRFLLFPELLNTVGVSTNLSDRPDGSSGAFAATELSARLLSDFSRHELEFNGAVSYRRNFAGDLEEDPEARFDGRLRLDIDPLTEASLRGALTYRREDPLELDLPLGGTQESRPEVLEGSIAAAARREFGPVILGGTLTAARESYSDVPSLIADPSSTTLTAALRTGLRLSPAIVPFIEGSLGRRTYDEPAAGADGPIERNALIPALRAGVELDFTEKLRGEIAVGYASLEPDDERAIAESAPTLDAELVWSPRRGTDVTLTARTLFEPDGSARSATATYEGSLGLRHRVGARTELTAALAAEFSDSSLAEGDELLVVGEAGFAYWLNRGASIEGRYTHRERFSDAGFTDYASDTISLGVRLRR